MKRLSRIGWACACSALLAPAAARADSVSVMTSVYESSFMQLPAEHEHPNAASSMFSWCRRCSAPDASPYLVSTSLSPMSSESVGGLTVAFNGGFSAVFSWTITFPVPAVSSTTTSSSGAPAPAPSITLPAPHESDHGEETHESDHGDHGGGPVSLGSGPKHDDKGGIKDKVDHVAGGVTSTGHAVVTKTEKLAATPEPATLFLLGVGLVGIAGRRARQAWMQRG